jgi:N6-L-threonylcarbamoyladenine synthase
MPLVAVNHLHAHVYACRLAAGENVFPCVGLVVSGGHSSLYECRSALDFRLLGGTIDDAAGEAFDKVASMLGLGFPGGPAIERAAAGGRADAYDLPRALIDERDRLEFSFSGLKTAVRYQIARPGEPLPDPAKIAPAVVADLAASFQEAVADCLVDKSRLAVRRTGLATLCVGGGVAANGLLPKRLDAAAREDGFKLHVAPLRLCTDNAVMGAIALEQLKAGLVDPLDADIHAGLVRPGRGTQSVVSRR